MNLGEVRALFVIRSGREDLINDDDSDNGANFYIQSGQRTLDKMLKIDKSYARSFKELSAGDYYAVFEGCRAVKRVWISTDNERVQLERVTMEEMRSLYTSPPNDVTQGDTLYYCIIPLRVYPDDGTSTIIDYFYNDVMKEGSVEEFEYTGILFLPPPDEASLLEVFGLFKSTSLDSDSDESFWSVNYPEILLMAALYHLEVSYRNTEGARDWMNAITFETQNLEKDWVENMIAETNQMEG